MNKIAGTIIGLLLIVLLPVDGPAALAGVAILLYVWTGKTQ